MLRLFPQFRKRILLNITLWLIFLIAFHFVFPSVSLLIVLLGAVVGVALVLIMQSTDAAGAHNRLLTILYHELDAERFISQYEPLLKLSGKDQQLELMIRLHLSNAYCALGRFEDAVGILSSMAPRTGKPEKTLLTRFAVASNLCYCAAQAEDLPAARAHLDALLAIKVELEQAQANKPQKKRMTFSTALNEQYVRFLETGSADLELLKSQVQGGAHQLQKVTTSLWVARTYLSQNNRREAEKLLRRIVELAPQLHPGQRAEALLASLPAKS